jgi:ketosteroid isomerase-like protein
MAHPSEDLLREMYACFARGDIPAYLDHCDDSITFTVPGSTSFSGTHTKATFGDWIGKVMVLCGGQFRENVVDVFANDDHAVVVLDHFVTRDGKDYYYRVDHIYGLKDGKATSFLERPGNEDEFNKIWS